MGTYKTINQHKGKYAYPLNASLNVRSGPGLGYEVVRNVKSGTKAGIVTKEYFFPETGKAWVKIALLGAGPYSGWVRIDVVKIVPKVATGNVIKSPTKEDTQELLDRLVESDQAVAQQLAVWAEMLARAEKLGRDITNQKKVYENILRQLEARQKWLKNSSAVKIGRWSTKAQDWLDKKFNNGWNWLKKSVGLKGVDTSQIGAIAWISIGVASGVLLLAGAAAYRIIWPKYNESAANFKKFEEYEKWLETLPPDTQKKITSGIEEQIDDAYNAGRRGGWFSGIGTIVKPLAIGGLALWGVPKLIGMWGKHNSKVKVEAAA